MKKIEILEVGMVVLGLIAGGAGLAYGGMRFGMKQGEEAGHKEGFNKGATAQYEHMMKDKGKKAIGFGPQEIAEESDSDE